MVTCVGVERIGFMHILRRLRQGIRYILGLILFAFTTPLTVQRSFFIANKILCPRRKKDE